MSTTDERPSGQHPRHGQIGYLQLPALDINRSARFYEAVFGWSVDTTSASFEAPGMIGQWTTERSPSSTNGPVVWICADDLSRTLNRVEENGGTVHGPPQLDGSERWLVEIDDPAGNRIGIVVAVRPSRPQPLITVNDVEASSRWYQQVLGLRSDHGGPHYDRLLSADGVLVLQLHHWDTEHDHGRIGDPALQLGNGVLLWFELANIDAAVERANRLGAPIVLATHRNPPSGEGNGPGHREVWIKDVDGYTVVIASPDGEAFEP